MKMGAIAVWVKASVVPAMILVVLLMASGCGPLGGMIKYDDGTSIITTRRPLIPQLPPTGGDTGDTGDTGDGGGQSLGYIPEVSLSCMDEPGKIVATFSEPVSDCQEAYSNDLLAVTTAAGVDLTVDEATWNEDCTEVTMSGVSLTYVTTYDFNVKTGLMFSDQEVQEDLSYECLTPANYYSREDGRYAELPTPVGDQTIYNGRIYDGEDILPDALPRDPLQFTTDDVSELIDYVPGGVKMVGCPSWNMGEGRFAFALEDGISSEGFLMLFKDIAQAPIGLSLPRSIDEAAYTDLSDGNSLGLDGNASEDLAFVYYDTDVWSTRLAVIYDWTDAVSDMTKDDVDWYVSVVGSNMAMGDFNGDRYEDLCFLTNDTLTEGQAFNCYFGSASGLGGSYNVSFVLPTNYRINDFQMGDVNCDGYADIILAGYTPIPDGHSTIYIRWVEVFPGGSGVTGRLIVNADISAALRIESDTTELGNRWLMVGDVNGDMCEDLFMSAVYTDTKMLGFKGNDSIAYASPQLIGTEEADIVIDDANSSTMYSCSPFLDINGDGYKELMYIENYNDFDLLMSYYEYIFVSGGSDFFGPDQITMGRADADSRFILGSWALIAE